MRGSLSRGFHVLQFVYNPAGEKEKIVAFPGYPIIILSFNIKS
jgi:hypothetical protein